MHTLRRTLITLIALTLILLLAAPAAAHRPIRQDEPVTLYISREVNFNLGFDPQLVIDDGSVRFVENLFLSLVSINYDTNTITPELASSWAVSEDGLVWTFTLRDDVPWVHWDAAAGEGKVLRMVTAHDAAYGIQRACDPRIDAPYQALAVDVLAGCNRLAQLPPETVTNANYALVQARALDDATLQITLVHPAGYFLGMLQMWPFRPVPQDIIAQYGDAWADPENLVTNGPFMLAEFVPDVRAVAWRNHHLPQGLQGTSNVERVMITSFIDIPTSFVLYQAGQIDTIGIPPLSIPSVVSDPAYVDQVRIEFTSTVWYLGFAHDKPPFDNMHVRRAFAAMIDRDTFYEEIVPYVGVPMRHITPPGIFGAPPIDEVGVGFDPAYAREQLALAGYPNCEGLPQVEIATFVGQKFMAYIASSAETVLGCDPGLFTVNWFDSFADMWANLNPDLSPGDRPHMWLVGWGADYSDANNYVGDMLGCEAWTAFNRPCSPVDDLIDQAARETDVLARVSLYREIEERFFGVEGEVPVIPLMIVMDHQLEQPWITEVDDGVGGWGQYIIDQEMQLAARGE